MAAGDRVERVLARVDGERARPWSGPAPCALAPRRWYAVGDPQCALERLARVLDAAGLLGDDGSLLPEVGLVSLGDHFDFGTDPALAADEGERVLRWLALHPAEQVRLVLGNHDVARVQEFAAVSDARFLAARSSAVALEGDVAGQARFREGYPELPVWNLVARDYGSFTTAQRGLVQALLLAGRYALALTATMPDGAQALVTHAGVTARELTLLSLPQSPTPSAVAEALARTLGAAVDAVREDWRAGGAAALSLAPLHVAGDATGEGGGLLYHRPAAPARSSEPRSWDPARPRRFDPRTLPVGLVQVVGHTGHHKCLTELGPWASEEARSRPRGGLRTLASDGQGARYELGVAPPRAGEATMYLADGELARPELWPVPLLALRSVP